VARLGLILGFCLLAASAAAKDACFGTDADAMSDALSKAGSCRAAFAKFSECAWGSSADLGFGDIVVKICEGEFLGKLSAAGKANYQDEAALCDYEHERQDGTMYRSMAAMCRAGVAQRYAETPALGDKPLPRASFDCAKAATPLEKTICADPKLGRADVVLSRLYKQAMKSLKPAEQGALNADERKWMATLVVNCRLAAAPANDTARDCVRNAFERRFTAIDGCDGGDADMVKCVNEPE
jgi:uncharacterized protein YecT (DUF1311 family)